MRSAACDDVSFDNVFGHRISHCLTFVIWEILLHAGIRDLGPENIYFVQKQDLSRFADVVSLPIHMESQNYG